MSPVSTNHRRTPSKIFLLQVCYFLVSMNTIIHRLDLVKQARIAAKFSSMTVQANKSTRTEKHGKYVDETNTNNVLESGTPRLRYGWVKTILWVFQCFFKISVYFS